MAAIPNSAVVHPTACVEGYIGERTIVGPFAWVGELAVVGADCRIGPGARLGGDGFGYSRSIEGDWHDKLQVSDVRIADNVHIGANTCIDRGSYRPTTVAAGCRIDNLVHIAHNVLLGENVMVIAGAMIAGSVEVGPGAYIAPGAQIREHTTIGADAFVALGAVVTRHVSPGQAVRGVPATAFHYEQARRPTSPSGTHASA